jgi:uncharacterized membrane protein YkoI
MTSKFHQATALAMLAFAATGSTFAAKFVDNDALGIADAQTSLTQAVTAAEQHVGGKAARAEYERHHDRWVFDVEVVKGSKVMDVTVDPSTGQVLAATEDKADHEDEEDQGNHVGEQDRAD